MRRLVLLLLLVLSSAALAQSGSTLPASCSPGNQFTLTGANPGFYVCVYGQWVGTGPASSGGPGAGVASVTADNTGQPLFNINFSSPTGAVTATSSLNQQPGGSWFGNFNLPGTTPAIPGFSTAPTFPTGQFAASSRVSPITATLVGEYHYNEASGATVGIDYSGNGNNGAYFGTPTLTGTLKGGMISNGAGGMDLPTAFNTTGLTIANYLCTDAATALPANPSYPVVIAGLASATAPTTANPQMFGMFLLGTQGASPLNLSYGKYGLSPSIVNQTSPTVATIATQSGETLNNCHLLSWVRGTTKDQFFIDDHEVSFYQYQAAGSATTSPASGGFSTGMPHYATLPNTSFGSPYPLYYTFVFSSALTLDQIKALSGSAISAAGFRGITKGKTTFSDAGNQMLAIGDSITYGLNVTTAWPRNLTTVNPYTTVNIATPGWQMQNLIAECDTRAFGSLDPNMNTTISVMAGTNDMLQVGGALPNVTAAIAYQRTKREIQCLHGLKPQPRVIVVTMLARGVANGTHTPANDTAKNALNDSVRKDYAGADGIFDAAAIVGLGADGAADSGASTTACNGNACFGGDHVHPTQFGHDVMRAAYSQTLDYYDAIRNGINPKLITAATATLGAADVAVNANPSANSQTLTLPSVYGLVGTERYIYNVQTTGTNTVTIAAASGEFIGNASSVVCGNLSRCTFRAVLGLTVGGATADSTAGGHWEQTSGQASSGGSSGNATSIWNLPVSATPPTAGQLVGYDGTNIVGVNAPSGSTVPTGSGFRHITSGAEDPAARAVNLASSDVTGTLPAANLPVGSSSAAGILQCDGTTITCVGGLLTATGGGGGGAGLGANTFTGLQIMPVLQDTPTNDTGLVNAAVVANTAVTTLSSGEIITFNPVATNTTTTPTLNVNSLGAKVITKQGGATLFAGDLASGTTAIVMYNSAGNAGAGAWQLINPATVQAASVTGTQINATTSGYKLNNQSVHTVNACSATLGIVTTTAGTLTYTCTVTGSGTGSVCAAFPTNAAAALLVGGTGGITAPLSGNPPTATVTSGSTLTITFRSGATIQPVAGSETFSTLCDL